MCKNFFFGVQFVQRKYLWRFYVLKRSSAVRFSQIETKLSYFAIGKESTAERMCVFGRSRKAEMLSRTRWYKNCHNFSFLQFFNSKLGRMLCNSCSNRFCDFYIFPIVGIGAINFQSKKTGNPPVLSGVFSLQKKWKNFIISIFINYTIWLTFLWRICVSIVQGFPSRAFSKQRLAHSSASTKTIPAI